MAENKVYRSIDLFAGIGGIRMGFDRAFGDEIETVFASEWDPYAQQTYKANFDTPEEINGDITKIDEKDVPSQPCVAPADRAALGALSDDELTDVIRRCLIGDRPLLDAQRRALDLLGAGRSCLAVMATGRRRASRRTPSGRGACRKAQARPLSLSERVYERRIISVTSAATWAA